MVISHKMTLRSPLVQMVSWGAGLLCRPGENQMDNRGSKSITINYVIVKEQRVDDGWHGNIPMSKVYSTRFRNKLLNNFIQGPHK